MSEKTLPALKAAESIQKAAEPKVWEYVGPKPAPVISNLPGTGQSYRADVLPQEYIQFVLDTVPVAKYWWK